MERSDQNSSAASPGGPDLSRTAALTRTNLLDSAQRRFSIHVLVIAIIVSLIVPAVAFLVYVVQQHGRDHQHQVSETGERLAAEIGNSLQQEFAASRVMLSVFGSSGWLEADELERLHSRARQALAGSDRHLIVIDENMDQLLNTRRDFGASLPKTADPESATKALESGRPVVSNLFFGRVSDAQVFDVLHPATLPDGRERVLILTRNAESLGPLLSPTSGSSVWSYAVLDGAGEVVSKSSPSDLEDESIPTSCLDQAGSFVAMRLADETSLVFLQSVEGSLWSVCVWAPYKRVLGPGGLPPTELLSATAAWIGLALALAILLSSLISRSIAETASFARELGSGRQASPSPSIIAEIDEVRRTLADAAAERFRNEQRLELLMREMAHRAKNQIALTASLVRLCSKTAETVSDLEEDVTSRLLALGRSIEVVTRKGSDTAPLADLIKAQVGPFLVGAEDRLTMRGDDVIISESAAQPLSLVLHEFATNASKYGAWSQPEGKVLIRWHETNGELDFDWSETGVSNEALEHRGFGTTLVERLVGTVLHGTIERHFRDEGLSYRMVLPL